MVMTYTGPNITMNISHQCRSKYAKKVSENESKYKTKLFQGNENPYITKRMYMNEAKKTTKLCPKMRSHAKKKKKPTKSTMKYGTSFYTEWRKTFIKKSGSNAFL